MPIIRQPTASRRESAISPSFKRDVVGWDINIWGHIFDIWSPVMSSEPPKRFLELGANSGGLSLWAARKGHDVICSDYPRVRDGATTLHDNYGVNPSYRIIDATRINASEIDIIAAKSVLVSISRLNGIESMKRAVRSIYDALAHDGCFLFAENMAGTRIHQLARDRLTKYSSGLLYPTDEQWGDLLSVFDRVERYNFGCLHSFGPTPTLRRALSALDLKFNDLLPHSWKTVTIGIARKAS